MLTIGTGMPGVTRARSSQSQEELFSELIKLFPQDATLRDVPLMLFSIVFACMSVIPNYQFGGSFGKEFIRKVSPGATADQLEDIRIFCALMSAVVNGYINARSLNNSVIEIYDQGRKLAIPQGRVKVFFGLLMLVSLSGVAAIPNIQFVEDTIKGWTKAETVSMKVVIFLINQALNFRGVSGLNNIRERLFDKNKHEAAKKIRKEVLTELNSKLVNTQQLTPIDIESLSAGALYRDTYSSWVRNITSFTGVLLPAVYSFGAYFFSAKEAMEDLEGVKPQEDPSVVALFGIYFVAVISVLLKWAFLGRANYNLVQRFCNKFLATEILPVPSKLQINIRSQYPVLNTAVNRGLPFLRETTYWLFAAVSLTGAMGMVEDYLFNNKETVDSYIGAIIITLIGALGINYIDQKDVNARGVEILRKIWIRMTKDEQGIKADKYGNTEEEFIKKAMIGIASLSDNEILNRYTELSGAENAVLLASEAPVKRKIAVGQDRLTNHRFENLLGEIDAVEEDYDHFLNDRLPSAASDANQDGLRVSFRPSHRLY